MATITTNGRSAVHLKYDIGTPPRPGWRWKETGRPLPAEVAGRCDNRSHGLSSARALEANLVLGWRGSPSQMLHEVVPHHPNRVRLEVIVATIGKYQQVESLVLPDQRVHEPQRVRRMHVGVHVTVDQQEFAF